MHQHIHINNTRTYKNERMSQMTITCIVYVII